MAHAKICFIIAEVILIASGFSIKSAPNNLRLSEKKNLAQIALSSDETEAALQEIFCWAIAGPWDTTSTLLLQQMQGCGGYTIFSNYSDTSAHVTKIFTDDMKVKYSLAGWALLSPMVHKVWTYIAATAWPDQFKWFVKLEPDTFFRPRFLPQILARYDSEVPMGFAPGGHLRFQGSIEIVSAKILRHPKSAQLLRSGGKRADDMWFTLRFREVNFTLVSGNEGLQCEALCVSYNNVPDGYIDASKRNVLPEILTAQPTLRQGNCLDRDIVSIHPVKNASVYRDFQKLDESLLGTQHGKRRKHHRK